LREYLKYVSVEISLRLPLINGKSLYSTVQSLVDTPLKKV